MKPTAENAKGFKLQPFLRWLSDEMTCDYVKDSRILLLFQNASLTLAQQLQKTVDALFDIRCRVITDEKCTMVGGIIHSCIKPTKTSFCREEVRSACQRFKHFVVVAVHSTGDVQAVQDLATIAHRTKYLFLYYPMTATIGPCLPVESVAVSCGWFLNDTDSAFLRKQASLYLDRHLQQLPAFAKCYSENLLARYQLNRKPTDRPLLYCAAMFGNDGEYNNCPCKEDLEKVYGRVSTLGIVGFVVTPSAVAVRVALSQEQREMWSVQDNLDFYTNQHTEDQWSPAEVEMPRKSRDTSRLTLKPDCDPLYKDKFFVTDRGRTAHFLLGKVTNCDASTPRLEVSRAVSRETYAYYVGEGENNWIEVDEAYAKQLGRYWIVYFKKPFSAEALFAYSFLQ